MSVMKNIDDIDRQLLDILQDNSRITIRELSERLNLSTTPIHERIKKLERNGFIKGHITLLDAAMVGCSLTAFAMVTLESHSRDVIDRFGRDVAHIPEVMECYYVSGSWDYLLKVQCRDMDAYHKLVVERFSQLRIQQLHTVFVMSETKLTHKLPIL